MFAQAPGRFALLSSTFRASFDRDPCKRVFVINATTQVGRQRPSLPYILNYAHNWPLLRPDRCAGPRLHCFALVLVIEYNAPRKVAGCAGLRPVASGLKWAAIEAREICVRESWLVYL